jgi:hypothetical protein
VGAIAPGSTQAVEFAATTPNSYIETGTLTTNGVYVAGSDPADVNNGGEALVDAANAGGIAGRTFTLDVGTDGGNGIVTVDGATLDITHDLRIGSSTPAAGSGVSSGVLNVVNAGMVTAGSSTNDSRNYHLLGCVINTGTPTTPCFSPIHRHRFDDRLIRGP